MGFTATAPENRITSYTDGPASGRPMGGTHHNILVINKISSVSGNSAAGRTGTAIAVYEGGIAADL